MTILPQAERAVKRASLCVQTQFTTHRHLAEALAASLNAGAHERCPACLTWTDLKRTGAIAIYVPFDSRPPVAYVLCRRCARSIRGTTEQQAKLTSKIENYLDGAAK